MDCAVVNERGQETKKQKMNTGVKGLMEFVKSIPKPRKIIIEEGTLASWLLEVCTAYGEDLIITDPKIDRMSYFVIYGEKLYTLLKPIIKYLPGLWKKEYKQINKASYDIMLFGYGRFG
ncbi:TPA: hypothetical protein DEP21_06445 [Patescibacteria group bacterium]|nr:hypothetical protein [Candidatus Gracilibacteria bacterium]